MLRPFIAYLFIFSLLFMGIEGALVSSGGEHPHGDEYAHVLDSDDSTSTDTQGDNNHSSHCYHGHAGSIAGHCTVLNCDLAGHQFPFYQQNINNFAQAPPTPPPNA
ncbi:MAG: hypothetical protein KBT73_18350 [Marinobacter sp.]|jgi:hypothetical protein|uniref:hypothetical protein n=1 Tax=uncultured Marinobacter sp. TaxID=187379 RepID=UPI001B7168AA|nr:hypothetical protein [Marinobacter sp.]|tara:strand:- start:518 stop:835 length:318 start_codon:yes stop_codon:yes gene_type:complete